MLTTDDIILLMRKTTIADVRKQLDKWQKTRPHDVATIADFYELMPKSTPLPSRRDV